MTGFADILSQRLNVAPKDAITPKVLGQIAGNTVRNLHNAMLQQDEAPSVYERIVGGRTNAPETSIVLDLDGKRIGTIGCHGTEDSSLAAAAQFALDEFRMRSPHRSGQYSPPHGSRWSMASPLKTAWRRRTPASSSATHASKPHGLTRDPPVTPMVSLLAVPTSFAPPARSSWLWTIWRYLKAIHRPAR